MILPVAPYVGQEVTATTVHISSLIFKWTPHNTRPGGAAEATHAMDVECSVMTHE